MGPVSPIRDVLARVDWTRIVASVADWVTLAAFLITLVGVISALTTRGSLVTRVFTMTPWHSFTWTLSNTGASPVRYVAYHRVWITRAGQPNAGDDVTELIHELYPYGVFRLDIFDANNVKKLGEARSNELWLSTETADGAVIALTWQNELIPWLRKRQVALFLFGQPAIVLPHRRAKAVARDMISIGTGGSTKAIRREVAKANGGAPPTEQSIKKS